MSYHRIFASPVCNFFSQACYFRNIVSKFRFSIGTETFIHDDMKSLIVKWVEVPNSPTNSFYEKEWRIKECQQTVSLGTLFDKTNIKKTILLHYT